MYHIKGSPTAKNPEGGGGGGGQEENKKGGRRLQSAIPSAIQLGAPVLRLCFSKAKRAERRNESGCSERNDHLQTCSLCPLSYGVLRRQGDHVTMLKLGEIKLHNIRQGTTVSVVGSGPDGYESSAAYGWITNRFRDKR
ncbi:hypothetical protein SRHO_G00101760 [Serrasalmus rhombeus]